MVAKIWSLSLKTHVWPCWWKSATLNITPVIARAFEKVVYKSYVKNIVESSFCPTKFAYREGGSCTGTLLTMQHEILKSLDQKGCNEVRLLAMDFSKAFDTVKHDMLFSKRKLLPLNPYIFNWYLSFLTDR